LRDLDEMFLAHGFVFTHETVRSWQAKLALLFAAKLPKRRRGVVGEGLPDVGEHIAGGYTKAISVK